MAVVLGAAGSVCVGLGVEAREAPPRPTRDIGNVRAIDSARSSANANDALPSLARSTPLALTIPAIGLRASLEILGRNANGTVQVPTSYQQPGWYRYGASPGQLGSAVILGHVDSVSGPGIFFRLGALRPGDRVNVSLASGAVAHFVVNALAVYQKAQFPGVDVYDRVGGSTLQLVTCTGTFDYTTHHYLSNLVVYTSFVGSSGSSTTGASALAGREHYFST